MTAATDDLSVNGDCALREAIRTANTDSAVDTCPAGYSADTILLPSGTYTSSIRGARESRSTTVHLPLVLADHPIPSHGSASGGTVHVVQRGETLANIAWRYGTTVSAIMRANGLTNPDFIWVGQWLHISNSHCSAGGIPSGDRSAGEATGRWIEVVLSSQRTIAWQGNELVRTMVVSTGTPRYPTPTGRFRIYAKYPSVTMSGPGYHLPGVPDTMFFYKSYAIHGTYWHNNFGYPMSHGCVNLTKADAAWLYRWAPLGTLVVVRN